MDLCCENCGYSISQYDPANFKVDQVPGWEDAVLPATREALERSKFGAVKGILTENKNYRTLFLTSTLRHQLVHDIQDTPGFSLREEIVASYNKNIAPALDKVVAAFNVVGALRTPSFLKLATTDLSTPIAIFCFVTIEDCEDVQERLDRIGMPNLLMEGSIDTINNPPIRSSLELEA